jgi:hypothetical protein
MFSTSNNKHDNTKEHCETLKRMTVASDGDEFIDYIQHCSPNRHVLIRNGLRTPKPTFLPLSCSYSITTKSTSLSSLCVDMNQQRKERKEQQAPYNTTSSYE